MMMLCRLGVLIIYKDVCDIIRYIYRCDNYVHVWYSYVHVVVTITVEPRLSGHLGSRSRPDK